MPSFAIVFPAYPLNNHFIHSSEHAVIPRCLSGTSPAPCYRSREFNPNTDTNHFTADHSNSIEQAKNIISHKTLTASGSPPCCMYGWGAKLSCVEPYLRPNTKIEVAGMLPEKKLVGEVETG